MIDNETWHYNTQFSDSWFDISFSIDSGIGLLRAAQRGLFYYQPFCQYRYKQPHKYDIDNYNIRIQFLNHVK
jgi:hypothetical protein